MEGTKQDVEYWINQFNGVRKTINIDQWTFRNHVEYMDIYIQGRKVLLLGIFGFPNFPKRNKQVYVYSLKKWSRYSHH